MYICMCSDNQKKSVDKYKQIGFYLLMEEIEGSTHDT